MRLRYARRLVYAVKMQVGVRSQCKSALAADRFNLLIYARPRALTFILYWMRAVVYMVSNFGAHTAGQRFW